ncbi:MAG: heat-inducible transcription repressor HrcA [Deltaproteobacteria bacterium]|nr:heat-inducible transcription repressor HrcA [Deltaproteobacteria bacterium]
MERTLTERDRKILGAIVEEFVQTAEPVGSRHLAKKFGLEISPATVRNAMSDLEEMGLLTQPHTSAGRKPTDGGYRYYVDHLMAAEPLPLPERRRIRRLLANREGADVDEILETASRTLSAAAHQLGVILAPRFESDVFRRIDLVLLRKGKVLVILVSEAGVVHHRPVEAPEVRSQAELDQMVNYLNGLLYDLPLLAVKERILSEMATEKALYDSMLQVALKLGSRALEEEPSEGEVYVGDPSTLLDHPEFASVSRMKGLFEAFEKKGLLLKILDRASQARGSHVLIGAENLVLDLQDCAVVSATYGVGGSVGSVGVIGPTRMEYAKLIGLVNYVARVLGEYLEAR